jgi:hypothetical protein
MDIKLLTLATICTATLVATIPLIDHNPVIANATGTKQSTQTTTISLSIEDLNSPHILTINAVPNSTQFSGQIQLNGNRWQSLGNRGTQVNLTPVLSVGQNTLKITGNYYPADASIQVELVGKNTQVSQQTSGNGVLNQVIVIDVRR